MKQFLIDTNILIYYLNDSLHDDIKKTITKIFKSGFYISIITKMKLLGFKEHTEKSFNSAKILPDIF
ncbi:MAG TPA: hypothetical protein PK771_08065 [Spirochaetota bacterium]|nr:hypothetical protein [Spirochaetota bacterium]